MESKKRITILIVVGLLLLIIGISATYAFFLSDVIKEGNGSKTEIQTATIENTTLTLEGNIESGVRKEVYPGHKEIVELKVTAKGEINTLYNLVWKGTNGLKTTFNYEVYKANTKQTPSITCAKQNEVVNGEYHYYEECTNSNFNNLEEVISRGTIEPNEEEKTTKLKRNERLQATKEGNTIYYYVVIEYPNNESNQNIDMNGIFSGITTIDILTQPEPIQATEYLLAKNEMVHETFEDNGSIIDTGYRYEGATPNNYVTFNNELWRIIGVFDVENSDTKQNESLVKIIRNDSIGEIAWDTGGEDGSNDWTQSDIKNILNGQYLNGEDINYTYRNPNNSNISSNPNVSIPGKSINDTARSMMQSVKWYLGGTLNIELTASEFYKAERGTEVYGDNSVTWNGYIGLMYPSDYGYSTDSESCSRAISLDRYDNNSCDKNNWVFSNQNQWVLTPYSYYNSTGLILFDGFIVDEAINSISAIFPSIFLKSNVSILDNGKDGSQDKPYDLVLS